MGDTIRLIVGLLSGLLGLMSLSFILLLLHLREIVALSNWI
jgi:hypothetical protein